MNYNQERMHMTIIVSSTRKADNTKDIGSHQHGVNFKM